MQESRGLRVVQTSLFQLQPDRPGADHPFRTPAAIPVALSLDPKLGGHPPAAGDGFEDERFLPSLTELAVMHFFDFILDVAADDPVVRLCRRASLACAPKRGGFGETSGRCVISVGPLLSLPSGACGAPVTSKYHVKAIRAPLGPRKCSSFSAG